MSGIFGLTGHDLTNGNEKINKMGQVMAHRPWYQVDTLYNEDSRIGRGRLGIGIFNAEAQPINSEDEHILFAERTLSRGIFRYEALRSLMDRHIAGREEWTIGKISHIITFEMMMRRFFDA